MAKAQHTPIILGPTYEMERQSASPVAGIDEAGRGPWAGPVVAAAVILNPSNIPMGLNDSKKLSAIKRQILYAEIMDVAEVGVGTSSVEEIDQHNILQATFMAMQRAVDVLKSTPNTLLVDGNLNPKIKIQNEHPETHCIKKGDQKCLSIAAASIIAKVFRDKIMTDLSQKYPEYGWEKNAGYGVPHHQNALRLVGISPFHRKSFKPIRKIIDEDSNTNH